MTAAATRATNALPKSSVTPEKVMQAGNLSVYDGTQADLSRALPFRKRTPLNRNAIRNIARGLDITILVVVTLYAMSTFGVAFLDVSLGAALPYLAMPALVFWGLSSARAYQFAYSEKVMRHMARSALGASFSLACLMAVSSVFGMGGSVALLSGAAAVAWVAILALHSHHVTMIKRLMRAGELAENVVIIGATDNAKKLIQSNKTDRELNVVAIFDDRLGRAPTQIEQVPVVGTIDDLLNWDLLPKVDRIIVTVTSTAQDRVKNMIDRLRYLPNRVVLLLDLENFNPNGASLAEVADAPAAYVSGAPEDARRAMIKRGADIVIGSAMMLAFAPLMAVVAVMIKLDSEGPVFFKQKRHGFNNETIRVWKFRTMRPDKRAEDGIITQVTSDDDRVTKIGKFLRKTSLDELPQLLNILKGEMSLVGPRPHAVGMTTEETEVHELVGDYAHRHRVKPGLTGWAQINGSRGPVHTAGEVRERVRLDMEYVNRSSLWFDLYIMIMTAPCLLGDGDNDR